MSGSGKTTLARDLATQDSQIKIIKPRKKHTGFMYFITHNPLVFLYFVFQMVKSALLHGDRLLFRHRFSILLSTFEAFGSAQRAEKGIVILEEGLFQRLFSLHEIERSVEELKKMIQWIPHIDMVFVVDRNKEYFQRYRPSSNNVRAQEGEEYMQDWIQMILKNHENLQIAISELKFPALKITEVTTNNEILNAIRTIK